MKPKFRAWSEEGRVMYYDVFPFRNDSLLLSYDEIAFDEVPASDFVLMQSTGQKDCNNSDIFDADIVLEPWIGRIVGRVFYSSEDLAWKVLRVGGGEEYLSDYLDLQVCGNIYENPDLMEEFEE